MSNQNLALKVSAPYAEALLSLAKANNVLNKTNEDLSLINNTIDSSKDLQSILFNPLIDIQSKNKILTKLFDDKVNDFILKFLLVLVERRRIFLLNAIIQKYFDLSYKLESTIVVELSTAIPFNEMQQSNLITKLKAMTSSNNIKLVMSIDKTLIGGFIVKIGSKVIDTSLAGKLKQISFYLNQS
uniref:ATP synthase CF1 subunit delta n=1 Tax=Anotrichium furcellatum TaxID=41999 RepID=A0A4D6WPT2_9FLOR|nr:ATP synthase CF1 subunit delta [Anotrichium furcellatum]